MFLVLSTITSFILKYECGLSRSFIINFSFFRIYSNKIKKILFQKNSNYNQVTTSIIIIKKNRSSISSFFFFFLTECCEFSHYSTLCFMLWSLYITTTHNNIHFTLWLSIPGESDTKNLLIINLAVAVIIY